METFLFALAGYLIGSIPVAYLLTRKQFNIDLRNEGSRNIGARNAFEVTGNKRLGFAVLLLDMHKGIIPLVILSKLGYCEMIPVVAITIILGHCYPVWLKFHGGRGLATSAAIALLISPIIFLCWIIVYFLSGLFKKQIHLQSVTSILGCIIFEFASYSSPLFSHNRFICIESTQNFHFSILIILVIILSRHIHPVYEFFQKKYE
jgi:glycerol-3-phosphate acyltransferase PlsY